MCSFQMEMSPIQGNFLAGEMQAELYPELLFYVHREEHLALYNFLQLGRKKENNEGSVGIVAINNLSCGSCGGWGDA